jgi:tetratricopeptide (TPR) repeat protein
MNHAHSSAATGFFNTLLDELKTTQLFENLLQRREDEDHLRAAREFLAALARFGRPSYETLALRFPADIIDLEEIYVPLRAIKPDGSSESLLLSEAMRLSFQSERRMLFIEGAPGSGKSTLIRQMARNAWGAPKQIGLDRRYLALPLRLRGLALSRGASLEDRIWNAIEYSSDLMISGSRPPLGFLEKWPALLGTPWLFLLDGFDEVPEANRAGILALIREFMEANARLLITSRPTFAMPPEILRALRNFTIEPFSAEQQHRLAEIWLQSDAADFEAAFSRFGAGALGGTPLLLTIAAITYRQSRELPKRRSELYRVFVDDTWQEAWRRGKADELGTELIEIAPAIIPLCLKKIARLMTEGRGEGAALDFGTDAKALVALIKRVLISDAGMPDAIASFRAEKVFKFLGSASGIFKASQVQSEWLHPTFREYLAAEDLVASCNGEQLREVLNRFKEPTWRQVALFIISILSERGSVSSTLRELEKQDHPEGLEFVSTAIGEGAEVDDDLRLQVFNDLSDDVRAHAKRGVCERLLVSRFTGRETRRAVSVLARDELYRELKDALADDLGKLARAYGRVDSSAVADLKELGMMEEIHRLAADTTTPVLIRAAAARDEYLSGTASDKQAGLANILNILKADPGAQWPAVMGVLTDAKDIDLFVAVAGSGLLSPERWANLLDRFREEIAPSLLMRLADSQGLPPDFRTAAKLRLATDRDEIIGSLHDASENAELAKASVTALTRIEDKTGLLAVAKEPKFATGLRRLAITALTRLGSSSELTEIVEDVQIPYSLRRRVAEALYSLQPMELPKALFLRDHFFDQLGRVSDSPRIQERRAFLNYILNDYERAIDLLDRAQARRVPSAWLLGICGHCLQLLGRDDDAIAAYSSSLERNPNNAFARCQRSILYWAQGKRNLALADIKELSSYSSPPWYLKQAGDMLRKAGKIDLADDWLDRALQVQPEAADEIYVIKGEAKFDRGYFGSAIQFFQTALKSNPSYLVPKARIADVFRVAGHFDQSVECYTELLSVDSTNVDWLYARAQGLMRLGKLDLALVDLQEAAKLRVEPWCDYLEALHLGFSGDREGFMARIQEMIRADAFGVDLLAYRSNLILLSVAAGNMEEARRRLDTLMEAKEFDYLSYNTIAELDDLATALSDLPAVSKFCNTVKKALWPDGCGIDFEPDPRLLALKRIRRGKYPCPMYCQKEAIGGLEQDKELATDTLRRAGTEPKTIVLWRIEASTLFGQCNFKKDEEAEHELKFCDKLQTVLHNLQPLVTEYGVRRLLFLEKDLLEIFGKQVTAKCLPAQCRLVDEDWIPKPRVTV